MWKIGNRFGGHFFNLPFQYSAWLLMAVLESQLSATTIPACVHLPQPLLWGMPSFPHFSPAASSFSSQLTLLCAGNSFSQDTNGLKLNFSCLNLNRTQRSNLSKKCIPDCCEKLMQRQLTGWSASLPAWGGRVLWASNRAGKWVPCGRAVGIPSPTDSRRLQYNWTLPWSTLAAVAPWNLNGQESINYLLLPVTQIRLIKVQTLLAHKFSVLESVWRLFRWMLLGKFSKLCLKGWSQKRNPVICYTPLLFVLVTCVICVYTSHIHFFEMDFLMSIGDTKPKVLLRFQKEEEGHDLQQLFCRNRTASLYIMFYKITLGKGAVLWAETIL